MARRPTPPGTPEKTGLAHFADLVTSSIPPLHPAGIPFVAGPLVLALLGRRRPWLRRVGLFAAGASAAFFRHPNRVPPHGQGLVVAPADGEVALVDTAVPPAELNLGSEPRPRVSIFLSVLDVHVQRSPIAGTVQAIAYRPGKFVSADLADASEINERNSMLLQTATGEQIAVVQIAGLLARRIVCDVAVGDSVSTGQTYGLIRFGSRVDTYFPVGTQLLVHQGQRAVGAETILAQL